MKKLLLILLCLPFFGFGQTKERTQNFIINKIERQEYCKRENIRNIFSTSFSVKFEDGNIKISEVSRNLHALRDVAHIKEVVIPIKSLKDIYFEKYIESDRTECLQLWMKSDRANIIIINKSANEGMKARISDGWTGAHFKFNPNIKADDLDTRLIEAFQHLVKLYGGRELKDPF